MGGLSDILESPSKLGEELWEGEARKLSSPIDFGIGFYTAYCATAHTRDNAGLCQTDGQTDRQTDRQTDGGTDSRTHDDSIYRASIA